jgi:hypothetical protein
MKKVEITCDNCGKDLRHTNFEDEFRLVLSCEPKSHPGDGATTYATGFEPDINRQHHFCDMRCLGDWLKNRGSSPQP